MWQSWSRGRCWVLLLGGPGRPSILRYCDYCLNKENGREVIYGVFVFPIKKKKGQCHEIFRFLFFSSISFPPAPEYPNRTVSKFFENSRRYSQLKVDHRCRWHRWQMRKIFNQKNFNNFVGTPLDSRVNTYSIYIFAFKFTLRYLQPDINPFVCHRWRWHRWQICHPCRWYRRQFYHRCCWHRWHVKDLQSESFNYFVWTPLGSRVTFR